MFSITLPRRVLQRGAAALAFIARGAYETSPSTPAELAAEIRSAYDRWGAMIKQMGFEKQ